MTPSCVAGRLRGPRNSPVECQKTPLEAARRPVPAVAVNKIIHPKRNKDDRNRKDLPKVLLHRYTRDMATTHTLESCHCFASRRGARQVSRLYDRYLSKADIKSSQFVLLMAVSFNPGIQINELAELMVMERTTLVRALKPLQQEGWVSAQKPEAGRSYRFAVTDQGKAKIAQCAPFWEEARQELETKVGKARVEQIRDNNLAMSSIAL